MSGPKNPFFNNSDWAGLLLPRPFEGSSFLSSILGGGYQFGATSWTGLIGPGEEIPSNVEPRSAKSLT